MPAVDELVLGEMIRGVEGATLLPLAREDQCCGFGGSFSVRYPEISGAMVSDKVKEALAKILQSLPAMRDVADTFRLVSRREIDQGLEDAHTSRMRMAPWVVAPSALAWSPVHGEEVLVLSGDTPRGALLIALYPLADGSYSLIGSLESAEEHTPFVVGYKPDAPTELLFSTCWGCGGEGGAIMAGEDARIAIQPR